METRDCSLAELEPDWVVDQALHRPDGSFFRVSGREVRQTGGRNVRAWKQPLIFQPGGTVALVVSGPTVDRRFLVRAMAEPGSIGLSIDGGRNSRVLIVPSLQFSEGQLALHQKALAGERDSATGQPYKPIPLVDLMRSDRFDVCWEDSPEDPGRFAEKVNRVGLIEVRGNIAELLPDFTALSAEERADFVWTNLDVVRQLMRFGLVNSHLRAALSLLV